MFCSLQRGSMGTPHFQFHAPTAVMHFNRAHSSRSFIVWLLQFQRLASSLPGTTILIGCIHSYCTAGAWYVRIVQIENYPCPKEMHTKKGVQERCTKENKHCPKESYHVQRKITLVQRNLTCTKEINVAQGNYMLNENRNCFFNLLEFFFFSLLFVSLSLVLLLW